MYVCMYVCVCMCVCMHVCMRVLHCIASYCMYVCMHACLYVCMHVCMYVCTYLFTYVYICMHVYIHACMYVCLYVCMYVRVCVRVCMYACIYVGARMHAPLFFLSERWQCNRHRRCKGINTRHELEDFIKMSGESSSLLLSSNGSSLMLNFAHLSPSVLTAHGATHVKSTPSQHTWNHTSAQPNPLRLVLAVQPSIADASFTTTTSPFETVQLPTRMRAAVRTSSGS